MRNDDFIINNDIFEQNEKDENENNPYEFDNNSPNN